MKIQQVFGSVEPFRVATDLGLKIERHGSVYVVCHPQDEQRTFALSPTEFVALDPEDPFLAGSIFDFLQLILGVDYPDVVQYVIERYSTLAHNPAGYPITQFQKSFIHDLVVTRKFFMKIVSLRNNLRNGQGFHEAQMCLRGLGIDSQNVWSMVYAATGNDLNEIFNPPEDFPIDQIFLACPFFINYHTLASIKICDLEHRKELRHFVINNGRYAFFGLHSQNLVTPETCFYPSTWEAMAFHSSSIEFNLPARGSVSLQINSGQSDTNFRITTGSAFYPDDVTGFAELLKIKPVVANLTVCVGDFKKMILAKPGLLSWNHYIRQAFETEFQKDGCTFGLGVRHFADSLKVDKQTCDDFLAWLKKSNRPELISKFKKHIDRAPVCRKGNDLIVERDYGYGLLKNGTSQERPISNFVLRIDHNIWFEDHNELFHAGRVLMQDREFHFTLSSNSAAKAREIEHILTTIVASHPDKQSLPTISDQTCRNILPSVISNQVANLPQYPGVSRLGWNSSKTKFTTPSWQVQALGIVQTSQIPYPHAQALKLFYSFTDYTRMDNFGSVQPEFRSFVALVAGMLGRSYAGLDAPPMFVRQTANTLNVLHAVFLALGQKSPITVNPNKRVPVIDAQFFSGYPVMATVANPKVLEGFKYPMVVFRELGIDCETHLDVVQYRRLYSLSYHVLTQMVLHLIQKSRIHFDFNQSDSVTEHDIILEGKRWIETCTDVGTFDILHVAAPKTKRMFSTIELSDLTKHVWFDLKRQQVQICFDQISGSTKEEIYEELRRLQPDIVMFRSNWIGCPSNWMMTFMEDFYGRSIAALLNKTEVSLRAGPGDSTQSVTA